MSDNPLVSIIVRTKDREELLKRALRSIASQTYRPIEVVLVNDGGHELNLEEIKNILEDVTLSYIRLKKNMGRSYAGNIGLKNASGEYIGFLDDDDEFYPEHIETLVNFLKNNNLEAVYTDSVYLFQEKKDDKYITVREIVPFSQDFDYQKLLISNYIPILNLLFKKKLLDKTGLFDEELDAHEDWDLWIRLGQYTDFYHVKKITAKVYMKNDGTTITSSNRMAFLKTAKIIHNKYCHLIADERLKEDQSMVEWLLATEAFVNDEKLENNNLFLDVIDNVIRIKNKRIGSLESEIRERDLRIGSLESEIRERDLRIGSLESEIRERDLRIGNLESEIRERDLRIGSLESEIRERDLRIGNLESEIRERENTLNRIYNSRGWKALLIYYKIRDKLFPPDSKRRKLIGHALNFSNKIFDKLINSLTRFIVWFYSTFGFFRRCFYIANSLSSRFIHPLWPSLHDKIFVDFKFYIKKRWLTEDGSFNGMESQELYYGFQKDIKEFNPKVSIVVPNYNHASYLRRRLDSIYNQTYKNIEVILLDDGSTDESTKILKEYAQRYQNITRCYFNNKNSGSVFYQWKRGIELAQGELIWIAESDDYCSENFLEELVEFFANEGVMLAFCKTVFTNNDFYNQTWSMEEYLSDVADPMMWNKPFVKSANHLVNTFWGIKNIIPNVSSVLFRNPGDMELLENKEWQQMKICGDWIFYLHIIRGGLVAYNPKAINFYRIHNSNTSTDTYKKDIYYIEHEKVAEQLAKLYRLKIDVFKRQQDALELHWRLHRTDYSVSNFERCYNYNRIKELSKDYKPNILMVTYALTSGGGETFPVRLANLLKEAGYGVTLLNCHREPTQQGVRKMLRKDIPVFELNGLDKLEAFVNDMGIDIVHSHHAWVDVTICSLLKDNTNCKIVITMHGMYEMMTKPEINRILPLLNRVNKFVYVADKNLNAFNGTFVSKDRFVKISNAVDRVPINPVSRDKLGIDKEAFVLCIVSRAIPEKGWEEGIECVKLARKISGRDIHLLLIGNGSEYERLNRKVRDHYIHFLGFKANVRDYFAASDLGFLPTRFKGESAPLVIIECLQANRPVLASDIGEIANMLKVESGMAGSVFPLNNWKIPINKVAEIIVEFATNKELYLSTLGFVRDAIKKFDPNEMLLKYESVYKEVLSIS
jgi:glycosyltransferase involved in cell wall biosynthesis